MRGLKQYFRKIPLQIQLFVLGLMPALPLVLFLIYLRIWDRPGNELMALLAFIYVIFLFGHLRLFWRACSNPFYTLSNLVRSLHQGDYGQRVVSGTKDNAFYSNDDVIGNLHDEINTLADVLQNNRFAAVESVRRFQYLVDQLDIGVVVFDERQILTMANSYVSRLFGKPPSRLLGMQLKQLSLEALWDCVSGRTLWLSFPEKSSRYLVHASSFREEGRPQRVFLLTDVKNPLREEERIAWKRLIRVLGHELNNSLTPIISLSQSLKTRLGSLNIPEEKQRSSIEALDMIALRAQGLTRFVDDYSKLAKLPDPDREPVLLSGCIEQIVQLLNAPEIEIKSGPDCQILVDKDQIEQMMINVLRNALESIPSESGKVVLHWEKENMDTIVYVDDNGSGIEEGENLFVPFFSTKPGGSGIGLVLSQQIAESNGGSIQIANREQGGCRVTIRLPLSFEETSTS